jgi:hypothetical protein
MYALGYLQAQESIRMLASKISLRNGLAKDHSFNYKHATTQLIEGLNLLQRCAEA